MPRIEVGFISSIANFREDIPLQEALEGMKPFEEEKQGDRELTQALSSSFAALCNAALKSLLAEVAPSLVTLRVNEGYGWTEGRKHWLRLGAEIFVEEEELLLALDILEDPIFAGHFDFRLEQATKSFVEKHLSPGLFGELSCSFVVELPDD